MHDGNDENDERPLCISGYVVHVGRTRDQTMHANVLAASVEQLKAWLKAVDVEPWSQDDKMVLRYQIFTVLKPTHV